MLEETVYNSRNNTIDVECLADGIPEPGVASITRVVAKLENEVSGVVTTLDSATTPTYFDWASQGSSGVLKLAFGGAGLAVGTYVGSIFLYNVNNPSGLFWGFIRFIVRDVG